MGIANIIFIVLLLAAIVLFTKNILKIKYNISLGGAYKGKGDFGTMARVALGQSKMTRRPIAGFLHILVYAGFVIINIEMLEIVIDGITGSHRVFSSLEGFYKFCIGAFEVLALLVLLACAIFIIRRAVLHIKRFGGPEMKKWPTQDAMIILITEIVLMTAFLMMNAADSKLMIMGAEHYKDVAMAKSDFWISQFLVDVLPSNESTLMGIERGMWWIHIIGVLAFLNYLPYSKHFHIILAFPNTYFTRQGAKGKFSNMESVTNEVKLMMDPNADPFAAPAADPDAVPQRFGAKDVTDLSWKNIMDAYTCTECGRCTDSCPANITGKKLSPRKIMMDIRDRAEELGAAKRKNGKDFEDGKSLLDYISEEEIWACTSCNACVQECPVNNSPLEPIIELRRYLVMEESKVPTELTGMLTNIENNQAPWQFSPADRLNWKDEA
ncbi:MAG: (Fe-S)-binding protein [Crocinitomicaceae bacterium]|nr:(Fe-S)-binding protein [Crocinitomicaceae bacterium]